jgi:hypothetical protein
LPLLDKLLLNLEKENLALFDQNQAGGPTGGNLVADF